MILVTNCGIMNFFHFFFLKSTIILHKHTVILPKTGKFLKFLAYVLNLRIELHSIPDKIGKLWLPWKLRNCSALHENRQIFWKWGVLFHKSKNFWKTKNFLRSILSILFDWISKFCAQIPHSTLKFRPCSIKNNTNLYYKVFFIRFENRNINKEFAIKE